MEESRSKNMMFYYIGPLVESQSKVSKLFDAEFLQETIPEVDVAGGNQHDREKLQFAEIVERYTRNPAIQEDLLFEIVRDKIGQYATDSWFDPEYASLPKMKRPPFKEAFKRKWMRFLDCDDLNKLIQGFCFNRHLDAMEAGLEFEQELQPYLDLAESDDVKQAAEQAKVARYKKILGGALMTQLMQKHPKPFRTVGEMITVIKYLNDQLGVSHMAQFDEMPFQEVALESSYQN